MPSTVFDALALGHAKLASPDVGRVLLTTSAGSWAVVAYADNGNPRPVHMLTDDFIAAGIEDGQQVEMESKQYVVSFLAQREAGYYPTEELTKHGSIPFVTFKLTEIQ
jgi:hypothetical protein